MQNSAHFDSWTLVTGLRLATRVSRGLGALVAVANVLVLLFYGFLLLFFGLGGSR